MKAKYRFLKVLIALFSMLFLVGCFRMTGYSPSELKTEKFGYDPDWQSKYESNEEVTEEVYTVEEGIDAEQDDEEDSDDEDSEDDSDEDDSDSNNTSDKDAAGNSDDSDNGSEVVDDATGSNSITVKEDGEYTTKEEVALYIHTYNHLPSNFITKNEATELGWVSSKGNLGEVAPGKSIGGDKFGNREGLLPKKKGRTYYECDINFDGTFRNGERIVFSDDGLIYYTGDHYESFELLYE